MDMDNKEKETDEAPKGNGQHGSNSHSGVDGMQEQCDVLPAIQFGTMGVKGDAPGNLYAAKNLNQIELVGIPKLYFESSALDDKVRAVSHADLLHREASLGLVDVGIGEVGPLPAIGQGLPVAALPQPAAIGGLSAGRQHQQVSTDSSSPGAASRADRCTTAIDRGQYMHACERSEGP
jgi:hypothetical protein